MKTIVVISDEPALAEALIDELPMLTVVSLPLSDISHMLEQDVALIVTEQDIAKRLEFLGKNIPHVQISRPVRLQELLYTIEERLQGLSPPIQEEIPLSEGILFLPRERLLVSVDRLVQIELTEKEADLLSNLLKAGDNHSQKEALLKQVWGYGDEVNTHTLETHVYRLRGKLKQLNTHADILSSDEKGYKIKL